MSNKPRSTGLRARHGTRANRHVGRARRLPSLALVGVSVREGCVLLTLDLRGLADAAWHGGGGGGGGGVGPGACAGQAPPLAGEHGLPEGPWVS